jgi:hypothetical protein
MFLCVISSFVLSCHLCVSFFPGIYSTSTCNSLSNTLYFSLVQLSLFSLREMCPTLHFHLCSHSCTSFFPLVFGAQLSVSFINIRSRHGTGFYNNPPLWSHPKGCEKPICWKEYNDQLLMIWSYIKVRKVNNLCNFLPVSIHTFPKVKHCMCIKV